MKAWTIVHLIVFTYNAREKFCASVTEREVYCHLDCITVILHGLWFIVVMLQGSIVNISTLLFPEFYVPGIANMIQMIGAAEVHGLVRIQVVHLSDRNGF